MLSALDEPGLQNMAGRGSGAVLWVTGNADRRSAKALDPLLPILRLHVEERAARKTRAIDKFHRCHRRHLVCRMLRAGHSLPHCPVALGTSEEDAKSRFRTYVVGVRSHKKFNTRLL